MKNRSALLFVAALCVLAPACSQQAEPAPTTTVTVTDSTTPPARVPEPAPAPAPAPAPPGADGSTGNDVSAEYCAQNEDPGCPAGSYVGPDAIPNPSGDGSYVPCEGTICTNPNYGGNTDASEADEFDPGTEAP